MGQGFRGIFGTDSEIVHNSQTFSSDSALDQSGRSLANETTSQAINASSAGTSNNPILIESSPEKTAEAPPVEIPKGSEPRPRKIKVPKILRRQAFHNADVSGATTTEKLDSDE